MNRIPQLPCTLVAALMVNAACADNLDPKAIKYVLPEKIEWRDNAAGTNSSAILYGAYAMLLKWKAGNMSRPHFHPNDRFFVVMSGTWWVDMGTKFDPDAHSTIPGTLT
jgi:hypothetical protein